MKSSRLQLSLLFLIAFGIQSVVAQGTTFTYQGRLDDNATPANGSYDFRFRLSEDSLGNVFVGAPVLVNALSVTGGLFTVSLDFGAVFTGSNYWVQADVKTNGAGAYTTLTPLQKVMPTPYAIMANSASNLLGTLPAGQLTGTVGTSQLANNSVNTGHIIDGQVMNADLGNDSVNSAKVLNGSLVGADLANETVSSLQLADTIALGDSNSVGRLDVFFANTLANQPSISRIGSGSQISTYGSDGLEQIRLSGLSYGELSLRNNLTNNATAVTLSANGSSGGFLSLNNSNGTARAQIVGFNTGGALTLYQADGGVGAFIDGESAGSGYLDLRSTNGSARIVLDADAGDGGGIVQVRNASGATKVILDGQSTSSAGEISLFDADGTETMQILDAQTSGAELRLRSGAGVTTIELDGEYLGDGNAGAILLSKTNGVSTIQLYADFAGTGDGRIVTQELQITGGSDLSEQFDITTLNDELRPGLIVCIDPQNPGQLIPSTKSYDRTVAGVISGAGGVKPGMLMGQKGTKADGQHPVALTGRVYCWVDATHHAIEPGDLITTSDTPGHAMKVTDHAKAQGAIIGKAMTALPEGKGLVLMLVSLQ